MPALLTPLFTHPALASLFSDRATLAAMLAFEAALARAEAATGVIPASVTLPIAAACDASLYDPAAIGAGAALAGQHAIPLVKALTAEVAKADPAAAGFVHWGATSQDVIDTATVLQLRDALGLIGGTEYGLAGLARALAVLVMRHRDTMMPGRTLLQQAVPITFGLKAAGWLDAVTRHRTRLRELAPRVLVLQFGGAAGTLASLGDKGPAVAAALAADLRLGLPALSWHTARDRMAETACFMGLVAGTIGTIARDVALLMQTEMAEAFEAAGAGKGGSSTMPHKRNPAICAAILAAATQAPGLVATMLSAQVQEHERAVGGWHAEWATLPALVVGTGTALINTIALLEGLEVDAERMRANLDLTDGLMLSERVAFALATTLGKAKAHHVVEAAVKRAVAERIGLRAALAQEPAVTAALTPAALDALFDPAGYLGCTDGLIDAALLAHEAEDDLNPPRLSPSSF